MLTVLLKHRCGPTASFANEGGLELFRKMVRHLGNFSVMQVAKLLLLPKYAALQGESRQYLVPLREAGLAFFFVVDRNEILSNVGRVVEALNLYQPCPDV